MASRAPTDAEVLKRAEAAIEDLKREAEQANTDLSNANTRLADSEKALEGALALQNIANDAVRSAEAEQRRANESGNVDSINTTSTGVSVARDLKIAAEAQVAATVTENNAAKSNALDKQRKSDAAKQAVSAQQLTLAIALAIYTAFQICGRQASTGLRDLYQKCMRDARGLLPRRAGRGGGRSRDESGLGSHPTGAGEGNRDGRPEPAREPPRPEPPRPEPARPEPPRTEPPRPEPHEPVDVIGPK